MLIRIALMRMDLPEPVAPAINKWGIFVRSQRIGLVSTSRPKAAIKGIDFG